MFTRRFVKVLVGAAGLAGASAGVVYVTRPDLLVEAAVNLQRYHVGFRTHSVQLDDGFRFHYAVKGRPQEGIPTIVMLHGFSGDLNAAVTVTKHLSRDAHVISIDAPGHGKTWQVNDNDLHPKVMAHRIRQLMSKTKLNRDKFHLVGWAMGGTIAGFYAAEYPEDVTLLTVAAPAMRSPVMQDTANKLIEGDWSYLLPVTEEEQKRFWRVVMYKNNNFPKAVLDYIDNIKGKRRKDHTTVLEYLIKDTFIGDSNLFITDVRNITTPTQIIWGEKDALCDVSAADLLETTLGSNAKRKDILPECGHAFYAEEPHTLAGLITAFQMDHRLYGDKWKDASTKSRTTRPVQPA